MYLAVLAAAAIILLLVPETVHPRTRPTLGFAGLGIPERGRGEFIAAAVAAFVAFALLGLFSSLVPGFIGGTFLAVLTFSALLAVLCLFSIARIASPGEPT